MNTKEMYLALSATVQNKLPDLFIEQIRAGYTKFQVGHTEVQPRLCQLVLQNPKRSIDAETGEEFVTAKIQLNMILATGVNPTNNEISIQMVALGPNKAKVEGQSWSKGFYSPLLRFDKDLVAGGFITADEQRFLFDYVSLWEQNTEDNFKAGSDATKQRVYLRTKAADSVFQFGIEERYDRENQPVVGMTAVGWTPGGLELFGTGITGAAVKIEAAVESFQKGSIAVSLSRPVGDIVANPAVATGGRSI